MAPNPSKPSHKSSKPLARRSSSSTSSSTRKPGPKSAGRPPTKQLKTKPAKAATPAHKRKRPTYTDKQLSLPSLNMITPAGITKANRTATGRAGGAGTGKRKNKVFVDDRESMMTIMALVNAEKEGSIESRMIRMRRLEEIREARVAEGEKRREGKLEEMGRAVEGVKMDLRKKGKGRNGKVVEVEEKGARDGARDGARKSGKKRVSFA